MEEAAQDIALLGFYTSKEREFTASQGNLF